MGLALELNEYLKKRYEKLSPEAKGILGLDIPGLEGQDRQEFVLAQWSMDFYKQKILDLTDDLRGTERYLQEVIHNTNYC